jgi:hypothetical protein
MRLVERTWTIGADVVQGVDDSASDLNCSEQYEDFAEIDFLPGWEMIGTINSTVEESNMRHQLVLFAKTKDLDLCGSTRHIYERWSSIAKPAGRQAAKDLQCPTNIAVSFDPACWVWIMKHAATQDVLGLRMVTRHLDQKLRLAAYEADQDGKPDACELLDALKRHGEETFFDDVVMSSIFMADWLSSDWPIAEDPPKDIDPPIDHVTLQQVAPIVNRSKRTLERLQKADETFPIPDVEGGGGKSNEWSWAKLRPYLEEKYGRKLPDRFPAHVGWS